jgi:hypothetical protein
MHRVLLHAMFGWLALAGTMHFVADVVAPFVRGTPAPGADASSHVGMHTSFALGQVLFGLLGLVLARRAIHVLDQRLVIAICVAAAAGWLAISLVFMAAWEPKVVLGVFAALVFASIATS